MALPDQELASTVREVVEPYSNISNGQANLTSPQARLVVKAFRDFILPIVHTSAPANSIVDDVNYLPLSPEATQLLAALEKFVTTLVAPKAVREHKDLSGEEEQTFNVHVEPVIDANLASEATPQNKEHQPPFLESALEEVRYRVFNKMPIRMLAFKSDGSRMELVERNGIWDRISSAMISDFNEDMLRSGIRDFVKTLGYNESHAEKAFMETFISRHAAYAAVSHTWLQDSAEVTYADWKSGRFDKCSKGYLKLTNFCKVAAVNHGLNLGWMDTICINKDSSAELDESIRSMFKWYHDASVCVTYLAQSTTIQHMHHDPWFTRGWTLQELMAPHHIKFYDANWQKLCPKNLEDDQDYDLIREEIRVATTITSDEFHKFRNSSSGHIPISRKMQWASNRRVTREEDAAYSLMGIFDVSISIAYGEGAARAFFRLVKEIMSTSTQNVLDIANWGVGPDALPPSYNAPTSLFIPSSPKQYLWRADADLYWYPLTTPITLTHLGVPLPILLIPALSVNAAAPNALFRPIGKYYGTADVQLGQSSITLPQKYNLLEVGASTRTGWNKTKTRYQIMLGVLNIKHTEGAVSLPLGLKCFAVCFSVDWHSNTSGNPNDQTATRTLTRVLTSRSIVFQLRHIQGKMNSVAIPISELPTHGMQLFTVYL